MDLSQTIEEIGEGEIQISYFWLINYRYSLHSQKKIMSSLLFIWMYESRTHGSYQDYSYKSGNHRNIDYFKVLRLDNIMQ